MISPASLLHAMTRQPAAQLGFKSRHAAAASTVARINATVDHGGPAQRLRMGHDQRTNSAMRCRIRAHSAQRACGTRIRVPIGGRCMHMHRRRVLQ
jgi:hypothetical protein